MTPAQEQCLESLDVIKEYILKTPNCGVLLAVYTCDDYKEGKGLFERAGQIAGQIAIINYIKNGGEL